MKFFNFDAISFIMISLTAFVGLTSFLFSKKYLHGDREYKSFLLKLICIITALIVTFISDNIFVLLPSWLISNLLLTSLMIHKLEWKEAYNAGILSLKYLLTAFACLAASFAVFYKITGSFSLQEIISYSFINNYQFHIAISLLSLFIVIQSGCLPFHKWITSSLNSPTPVSAIMHAGIVNGGGFIFIRFNNVYMQHERILDIMFIFGAVSVIIATIWKLMQNDIKRMLSCSTISQMGYMLCQCGIGLFGSGMIHIVMHGIFKASLFLHSPSSAEDHVVKRSPKNLKHIFLSVLLGFFITLSFSYGMGVFVPQFNASIVLFAIVLIFASQFSMTVLEKNHSYIVKFISFIFALIIAALYGKVVFLVDNLFENHSPLDFKWIHFVFIASVFIGWIMIVIRPKNIGNHNIAKYLYIKFLNSSQSSDKTITKNRNSYNF